MRNIVLSSLGFTLFVLPSLYSQETESHIRGELLSSAAVTQKAQETAGTSSSGRAVITGIKDEAPGYPSPSTPLLSSPASFGMSKHLPRPEQWCKLHPDACTQGPEGIMRPLPGKYEAAHSEASPKQQTTSELAGLHTLSPIKIEPPLKETVWETVEKI